MKKVGYKTKLDFVVGQLLSHVQLFCNPMDYSPPGPSVHRISQARILEQIAISFSRESSQPRDGTRISFVSCIVRQILNHRAYITKSMELVSKLTNIPKSQRDPVYYFRKLILSYSGISAFTLGINIDSGKESQIKPTMTPTLYSALL